MPFKSKTWMVGVIVSPAWEVQSNSSVPECLDQPPPQMQIGIYRVLVKILRCTGCFLCFFWHCMLPQGFCQRKKTANILTPKIIALLCTSVKVQWEYGFGNSITIWLWEFNKKYGYENMGRATSTFAIWDTRCSVTPCWVLQRHHLSHQNANVWQCARLA